MGYLMYYNAFILWFGHFLDSGAEIYQIFRWFFGKFKKSKRHSEIIWPLKNDSGQLVGSTVSLGVGEGPDFPLGWEVNFDRCYAFEIWRISFSEIYTAVWDKILSKLSIKILTILTKLTHESSDIWPFCHEINRKNMNINGRMRLSFTIKVYIFWEGHKILRNLHLNFVLCSASQKWGEDFAKFCGLLRIYEL